MRHAMTRPARMSLSARGFAGLLAPSIVSSSALCSPSVGGGRTSNDRLPSKETGERTVRNSPIVACCAETSNCRCFACGSSSASLVSYIGACGTSSASRRLHHCTRERVRNAEPSSLISASGYRCVLPGGKAPKLNMSALYRLPCLPELRATHVQCDPLAVGALHHRTATRWAGYTFP